MARAKNTDTVRAAHITGWYAVAAVVVGCLITWAIARCNGAAPTVPPTTTINQKGNGGASNAAGRDAYQNNGSGSIFKSDGPQNVTIVNSDTTKHPSSSGASKGPGSKVYVDHPSGGINGEIKAGTINYYQITAKDVQVLVESPQAVSADSGFICLIDTVARVIRIGPKQGSWDSTTVAIPRAEKATVNPVLRPEDRKTVTVQSGPFIVKGLPVYLMTTNGVPATAQFPYELQYDKLPTEILFGNFSGPMFKAKLK
jgi:hypothetical protein